MKIHEYQAKEILREFGVATPRGIACFSVDQAVAAAGKLGGSVWVVKAQIHAGGRGKGGGVKVARSLDEVRQLAGKILGMTLVTHQTGAQGQVVRRLLLEQGADIKRELYIGMVVDRSNQRVCLMASSEGGMDIEQVAASTPEKIHKVLIDPLAGLTEQDAGDIARKIGIAESAVTEARTLLQNLYRAFDSTDASLVEINPLVVTKAGWLMAMDAKMSFDDNAIYRHREYPDMVDYSQLEPLEITAGKYDLAYIKLDGTIGCLVNGAGLAMATLDVLNECGGKPANFLDVGGGATREKVAEAFKIILQDADVKGIFVNIFGGIMRCDIIAEGVVAAARELSLRVPLVVRLEGTNVELGKKILAESGLNLVVANSLKEAAQKAVDSIK